MDDLSNASILVTGGTGSFGKAFIAYALEHLNPRRIAVLSRDELKQFEMRAMFPDDRMRWFIGDIRDKDRLLRAFHGVDYIVHAAALKQVDTAEYNPFEYVKTNVLGSQNVIDAAIESGVKKVVALSTDKASSPINLYGATKLTADKLFVAANNYSKATGTALAVVRYGNVMGSRGSVIPLFKRLFAEGKPIPITDPTMTRFWITLPQAVDLVEAVAPRAETVTIGIRPGEKLHEEMIAADDSYRTVRQDSRYVVKPTVQEWWWQDPEGVPVAPGFSYRSDTNDLWLTPDDLRQLIAEN
jgi:UDP-N-acetylglucosamine 4,6-dehydratase